jgi:hypothetical protein
MLQPDRQSDMHNKRKSNEVKLINALKFSLWNLSKCNTCLSNPDLTETTKYIKICAILWLHDRWRRLAAWWRPLSTVTAHVVRGKQIHTYRAKEGVSAHLWRNYTAANYVQLKQKRWLQCHCAQQRKANSAVCSALCTCTCYRASAHHAVFTGDNIWQSVITGGKDRPAANTGCHKNICAAPICRCVGAVRLWDCQGQTVFCSRAMYFSLFIYGLT